MTEPLPVVEGETVSDTRAAGLPCWDLMELAEGFEPPTL